MTCPSCGCVEWKAASLVHTEGISTSESSTIGIGLSSGGSVGVGGASTSGAHQSQLSKLATPPATFVWTTRSLIGALVTAVLGFIASWWWAATALCVIGLVLFYRSETKEDDVLTERYKNTKMCTRCGTFYVSKGTS
jgi:hypothetical protein